MDITPLIPAGRQLIQGYDADGFRISGMVLSGSVLVFPLHSQQWAVGAFESLSWDDFQPVLAEKPEILILGSGKMMKRLDKDLRAALRAAGIVVEVMDSGAACRTYNVLLAEQRPVAAALFAYGL